jgi:hypothetical protein
MNLGEMKTALAKLPQDMNTAEVFFVYASGGQRQIDIICAVGIVPMKDTAHVGIVGMTEIERIKQATGEMPKTGELLPPGKPPCIEGDEWKQE